MTQTKPDSIVFDSRVDTFINYSTVTATLNISGTVGAGSSTTFSTILSVSASNTLAYIYAKNQNTGKKMSLLAGNKHHPYQSVGAENETHNATLSGGTLTVSLLVNNGTGSPITLTTQAWTITAVLLRVPY